MISSCLIFLLVSFLLSPGRTQIEDLKLWYDSPATNWFEALTVGNGRMGAMVYGDPAKETIQINEESLWAGKKRDANNTSSFILKDCSQFIIYFTAKTDYSRSHELQPEYNSFR